MTQEQKNRIAYLKYIITHPEALDEVEAGGCPPKWRQCAKRYNLTEHEIAQVEIAIHGILNGIELSLEHELQRY